MRENETQSEQQRGYGGTDKPGLNQEQGGRDPGGGTDVMDRAPAVEDLSVLQQLKGQSQQLSGITDRLDKMIISKGGAPPERYDAGSVQDESGDRAALIRNYLLIEEISTRLEWLETQN